MFEFQKKMEKEYNVKTLDDSNLSKEFVSSAKEFLQKVENKELDEQGIKDGDQQLVEYFDKTHTPEDSDEVKAQKEENRKLLESQAQTKKENLIKQAKIDVSKTVDMEMLEKLKKDYESEPEAMQVVENKINFVKEQKEKSQNKKAVSEADKLEQDRKEKQKQEAPKKTIIDGLNKLASMKGYYATYEDLRNIGINPTGDNMGVYGFKLTRQYAFKVYEITPPIKKAEPKKSVNA